MENIVDRIIMDVGIFVCKKVFHYDAEKACKAILKNAYDSERRKYILANYW